jgi:hypothetical protein
VARLEAIHPIAMAVRVNRRYLMRGRVAALGLSVAGLQGLDLLQKRIRLAFRPDFGGRSMSGQHSYIVAKRK